MAENKRREARKAGPPALAGADANLDLEFTRAMLKELSGGIVKSYEVVGGLNNKGDRNLPSKEAVASICEDLLRILFPGFHDAEAIRDGDLAALTAQRIEVLRAKLADQIRKGVRVGNPGMPTGKTRPILLRMFRALPFVRSVLRTDVEAGFEGDPAATSLEEIILSYPYVEAVAIQRIAHILYLSGVPILPRMMTEWAHGRTGIDIHPGASIGASFFIDHGTGVVIGETCRIGSRVKLYHGVTLGAKSFARDEGGQIKKGGKRHPDVGDGVTIYPNATILGGETVIGERSTIGANVFLMHSIPPESLVMQEDKRLLILDKKARRLPAVDDWSI